MNQWWNNTWFIFKGIFWLKRSCIYTLLLALCSCQPWLYAVANSIFALIPSTYKSALSKNTTYFIRITTQRSWVEILVKISCYHQLIKTQQLVVGSTVQKHLLPLLTSIKNVSNRIFTETFKSHLKTELSLFPQTCFNWGSWNILWPIKHRYIDNCHPKNGQLYSRTIWE